MHHKIWMREKSKATTYVYIILKTFFWIECICCVKHLPHTLYFQIQFSNFKRLQNLIKQIKNIHKSKELWKLITRAGCFRYFFFKLIWSISVRMSNRWQCVRTPSPDRKLLWASRTSWMCRTQTCLMSTLAACRVKRSEDPRHDKTNLQGSLSTLSSRPK